jgi:hypothetical protein
MDKLATATLEPVQGGGEGRWLRESPGKKTWVVVTIY